jgi:hypothetical protein
VEASISHTFGAAEASTDLNRKIMKKEFETSFCKAENYISVFTLRFLMIKESQYFVLGSV